MKAFTLPRFFKMFLNTRERSVFSWLLWLTIVNTLVFNAALFQFAMAQLNLDETTSVVTLLTLALVVFAFTFVCATVLASISIRLTKFVVFVVTELNIIALYFMTRYQVVLDKSMMGNIFNTSLEEAGAYLSFELAIALIVLTALCALIVARVRIAKGERLFSLAISSLVLATTLFVAYVNSGAWLWFDEHGKQLGARVLPWSYIVNSARYAQQTSKRNATPLELPSGNFQDQEKQVVILVIGETARAANFSQYAYERVTSPELIELGAQALPHTESCTTYTTGSLSCLLSHQEKSAFGSDFYEPLPTYLSRHGVDVIWRSNNWGEPHLAVSDYQTASELKALCTRNDCNYDGVLLSGLSERIQQSTADKVFLVLHLKGSHGPNYSDRYPPAYERYRPACHSVDLNKCTSQALINAYDNSLLYTDSVIASAIKMAQTLNMKASLLYISDHGESLGESGMYLHGSPKAFAPPVQYQIPFIVWTSQAFTDYQGAPAGFDFNHASYSQANIFHSVLGAFKLQSPIYQAQRDIFLTP